VSGPPRTGQDGRRALHRALRDRDDEVGAHVSEELPAIAGGGEAHGPQLAAAGPRAVGREDAYELALELIAEGHALHYRAGRVVSPDDPDLALLLGDRLYAEGLSALVALGDHAAVTELADVIALCAAAHARGEPELAEAAWLAGGAAVGHGSSPAHRAAKKRAGAADPGAAEALAAVVRQLLAGCQDGAGEEGETPDKE
jgi:hypothetical protein